MDWVCFMAIHVVRTGQLISSVRPSLVQRWANTEWTTRLTAYCYLICSWNYKVVSQTTMLVGPTLAQHLDDWQYRYWANVGPINNAVCWALLQYFLETLSDLNISFFQMTSQWLRKPPRTNGALWILVRSMHSWHPSAAPSASGPTPCIWRHLQEIISASLWSCACLAPHVICRPWRRSPLRALDPRADSPSTTY